ncbi:MAG: hypothetical protein E4G94_00610 [ANME-2 cluster archaeon]|nr:MAG: hypothetical protein E4G94_00610 [ANME-2 cluster archaeon]
MSPRDIVAAQEEYELLRPTIEKKYPNQFIAIDPISKEYFIDPVSAGALKKAHDKHPGRDFYVMRIGEPTAFSFSG